MPVLQQQLLKIVSPGPSHCLNAVAASVMRQRQRFNVLVATESAVMVLPQQRQRQRLNLLVATEVVAAAVQVITAMSRW